MDGTFGALVRHALDPGFFFYELTGVDQGDSDETISTDDPVFPHFRPVSLVSLTIRPVPLFTKARDGCRPYVEVYNEDRLLLSTMHDYERLHLFTVHEGKVGLDWIAFMLMSYKIN